jgi:hypothetical protein
MAVSLVVPLGIFIAICSTRSPRDWTPGTMKHLRILGVRSCRKEKNEASLAGNICNRVNVLFTPFWKDSRGSYMTRVLG